MLLHWSFTLHLKRWPCLPCLIFILCVHIFCASLALTQYKGDPSWHSFLLGRCLARTLCVYYVKTFALCVEARALVYKYRNSPPLYRLPSSLLFRNQFLCCLARRQIAKHPLYLSKTNSNTNRNTNANTKLQIHKHICTASSFFTILINPCWCIFVSWTILFYFWAVWHTAKRLFQICCCFTWFSSEILSQNGHRLSYCFLTVFWVICQCERQSKVNPHLSLLSPLLFHVTTMPSRLRNWSFWVTLILAGDVEKNLQRQESWSDTE